MLRRAFGFAALTAAVLLVAGAATGPVRASTITVQFTGAVATVDPSLSGTFSVGQALTGTYVYNDTTPPNAGHLPTFATFDALLALNFTIGSYSASSTGALDHIEAHNALVPIADAFVVRSQPAGPALGAKTLSAFSIRLEGNSSQSPILDAQFLPAIDPKLGLNAGEFAQGFFDVFFSEPDLPLALVSGRLNSLSVVPDVPIPAALPLFTTGLGVLALLGWRRKGCKRPNAKATA